MIKIINSRFIYDGRAGRIFSTRKYNTRAFRQIEAQSCEPIIVEDSIRENHAKKVLINKPLDGYISPTTEQIKTPHHYFILFQITGRCNLRCSYCPYSNYSPSHTHRVHINSDMSLKIVDQSLKIFYKYASPETYVGFYGGEPLIRFDLIKYIVNKINKNMPDWKGRFSLTTNLTIYSKDIGNFFAKNNFLLNISLDGPKHIHDRYRKTVSGNGSFESINENLTDLKRRYPDYFKESVQILGTLAPPFDFEALENFFSSTPGLNKVRLQQANTSNPDFYPSIECNFLHEREILEKHCINGINDLKNHKELLSHPIILYFWRQNIYNIIRGTKAHNGDIKAFHPFKACIPSLKMFINVDGSISICEKVESLKIGHVENGLDEERISQVITEWQKTLGKDCLNCWASKFCKACYLVAWDGTMFNRELLAQYCKLFRHTTEKLLRSFLSLVENNPHLIEELLKEDFEKLL